MRLLLLLIGLLLPASEDPQKDRETFLRILTMDDGGLWARKTKTLSAAVAYELLTPTEKAQWFELREGKPFFKRGLGPEDKESNIHARPLDRINSVQSTQRRQT